MLLQTLWTLRSASEYNRICHSPIQIPHPTLISHKLKVKLHVHSSHNNRSANPNMSYSGQCFSCCHHEKVNWESSLSSSDECGTVPSSCWLSDQVNQTYLQVCLQAAIVNIHYRHLVLLSPKLDTHFTIPQRAGWRTTNAAVTVRVKGWVET